MREQWRKVKILNGLYELSSTGRMRKTGTHRILKPKVGSRTSTRYCTCINGDRRTFGVMKLFIETWPELGEKRADVKILLAALCTDIPYQKKENPVRKTPLGMRNDAYIKKKLQDAANKIENRMSGHYDTWNDIVHTPGCYGPHDPQYCPLG